MTSITYADDGSILFGDKSGRAYQWTTEQQSRARELKGVQPIPEESKPGTEPTLMLGHCSLLTDMVRFIHTALLRLTTLWNFLLIFG